MMRVLSLGIAALVMVPGLAGAEDSRRFGGKYVLTQPRHDLNAKGSAKSPQFNPKEFKLDDKATWKTRPKSKTLCAPPGGGKPRAC